MFGLCLGEPWWRHQMETFSALLAIYAGNSAVTGEFPTQRPVTRSFNVFFDLRLNKQLSKQSWGWWLMTPLRPLWRHCNVLSKPCKQCERIKYFRLKVDIHWISDYFWQSLHVSVAVNSILLPPLHPPFNPTVGLLPMAYGKYLYDP